MIVEIDKDSGFCFGVVSAIDRAEKELESGPLYCLGEIVHNHAEVRRLSNKGLHSLSHEQLPSLSGQRVLIRAHGEPPQTYHIADKLGIRLVDATCPIVLKLQERVRQGYEDMRPVHGQVVIYGQPGHAEVVGLEGHTDRTAIVLDALADMGRVDLNRPIRLYSQTTKSKQGYQELIQTFRQRLPEHADFVAYNTICGSVAHRAENLTAFCKRYDVVIFVSGRNSSNGQYLFDLCRKTNDRTHLVADQTELQSQWFVNARRVGVCGATSTPMWLMKAVANTIETYDS